MKQEIDLKRLKKLENGILNSKSYIPIKSTEFLQKNNLVDNIVNIFMLSGTAHIINLNVDGVNISIINSYNRERAFSIRLYINGMFMPLGLERIIHRGPRAKSIEDITEAELKGIIRSKKNYHIELKSIPLFSRVVEEIERVLFRNQKVMFIDTPNTNNLGDYLESIMQIYKEGDYYIARNKKLRKARKKTSINGYLNICNRVYKVLTINYIYLFI